MCWDGERMEKFDVKGSDVARGMRVSSRMGQF